MNALSKARLLLFGLAYFFAMSRGEVLGAEIGDMKFYEMESGRITYTLSGFQNGTETLVWKDYGRKSKRQVESRSEFMGVKQENRQTTIMDGVWIYTLDAASQSATKMENPMMKGLLEKGNGNRLKTGEDMMRAMGGKIVGKETVLGKPCDLWLNAQMMNMTTCVWKGLPLMSKGGVAGMEVNQRATDLKIGKVTDEEVSLPVGMKVVERENPMEALQKMNRRPSDGAGMKNLEGMPAEPMEGQDPAMMMEQLKKMQEMMQEKMKEQGVSPK